MSKNDWENIRDHLCVICKNKLKDSGYYLCNKCNKVCEINYTKISDDVMDVKSKCCNSDIEMSNIITCGKHCHDLFVIKKIVEDGLFKKIIDATSGIAYKIPTKLIIEEGIRQQDLKKFPEW